MNALIHPYLRDALPGHRRQLLETRVTRLLSLEHVTERVEERHYDEQQRLRLHRIVDRDVRRGTLREEYAVVLSRVVDGALERAEAAAELGRLLDRDLNAAITDVTDVDAGLKAYGAIAPAAAWPRLLVMAPSPARVNELSIALEQMGCPVEKTAIAGFGIVRAALPPEWVLLEGVVGRLDSARLVTCVADGAAPVAALPGPSGALATHMADVPDLLRLDDRVSAEDGGLATLAVLDTGLDLSHPAFHRVARTDYRNFTAFPEEDEEGHGTHVCFLAAGARTADWAHQGIAPTCRLIVGKVMHGRGFSTIEQVLNGMAWAVFEERADVLSMSIGEAGTPANGQSIWSRAVDEAFRQGTMVCVAAGNVEKPEKGTICVPADAAHAVTVGAVDKAGHLAPFCAQGVPLEGHPLYGKPTCVAPGVEVVGARSADSLDGQGAYVPLSGTSMAAPVVAGCLALLKSRARSHGWEAPAREVLDVFYSACRPVVREDGESHSAEFEVGHGLVDMSKALATMEELARRMAHTSAVPVVPVTRDMPATAAEPCASCGRTYPGVDGMFSRVMRCATCGATVCAVCWARGLRVCKAHQSTVAKEKKPMVSREQEIAGQTWLERFSANTEPLAEVLHPVTLRSAQRLGARQTPNRAIAVPHGIARYNFQSRFMLAGRTRVSIVALVLGPSAFEAVDAGWGPRPDLVRLVTGVDGLDVDAQDGYYAIGLFSPVGWPDTWIKTPRVDRALEFHLVSATPGTGGLSWKVFGPQSPFQRLFRPESTAERQTRLLAVLESMTDLRIAGGTLAVDRLSGEFGFGVEEVRAILKGGGLGYQVVEHRGVVLVQRGF